MPAIIQTKDNFTKELKFKTKAEAIKVFEKEEKNSYWSKIEGYKKGKEDYRLVFWSWYVN